MKAVVLKRHGGTTTLAMSDIDRPALTPGYLRVAARAASVNRADILIRAGTHTPAANTSTGPAVAGLDVAGEVMEVGDEVDLRIGDRIMAMVPGGLAEKVIVPAAAAIRIPSTWSYVEGAAAVTALMTEHNALVTAGRMTPGETVVIHAAASGVGTQAVQLAVVLGAGKVIGTTRSHGDSPVLRRLGIDQLITVTNGAFAEAILDRTGGIGADVIIDHVGGPYLEENLRAAAIRGRIIGVGRLGGTWGTLDMEELARKRVEIIGTTFRTRTAEEKAAVAQSLRDGVDLERHADALRPVIDRTFNWLKALDAQEALAHNTHVGKIVLEIE
jgi:NADPH2:quinone reductase